MTGGRACSACGAPVRPPFRPPPQETAPDLDLRPGEPTRSTLLRWVQTCPRCGASGPDLAALPPGTPDVVAAPAYAALRRPGPDTPFLRWARIAAAAGDRPMAAEATLQAAWALDDAGRDASAVRQDAAALWGVPPSLESALRLVDVLRRAGAWDAAARAVADTRERPDLDETSVAILFFQQGRIAAEDAGRHLISSALRPPARTPHVTHGPTRQGGAKRGFWTRLFAGR